METLQRAGVILAKACAREIKETRRKKILASFRRSGLLRRFEDWLRVDATSAVKN